MVRSAVSGKIILLLDNFSLLSRRLHESLQQIETDVLTIVISEENFLPENVLSIYDLIIGNYRNKTIRKNGTPKYFNEIQVPDTWSFQAGDEKAGRISYQQVEKGRIHYVDSLKKRLVREVEWYDRAGVTRFCDHYNRYGDICARTVYNSVGEAAGKSWFSPEGQEVIVENYITRVIILNDEDTVRLFRSREELLLYCLKKAGVQQCRIFINSLSIPFLLVNRLGISNGEDVLFWQEIAGDNIPWNMKLILDGKIIRCNRVIVQTRSAYNRLLELGVPEDRIQKLGFIYSFEKENKHRPEALICTNSDRIEHCETLIKMLPQMHFHIAALTWMSPRLFALDQYDNVSLYPGAEPPGLDKLFFKCDYYFDINYQAEIVSAVYRAFSYNQLIFAFQETVHNREYVADVHTYSVDEFNRMVRDVQEIMVDRNVMKQHLERQQKYAFAENKGKYAKLLGI